MTVYFTRAFPDSQGYPSNLYLIKSVEYFIELLASIFHLIHSDKTFQVSCKSDISLILLKTVFSSFKGALLGYEVEYTRYISLSFIVKIILQITDLSFIKQ